jgi:hypothetical protein
VFFLLSFDTKSRFIYIVWLSLVKWMIKRVHYLLEWIQLSGSFLML